MVDYKQTATLITTKMKLRRIVNDRTAETKDVVAANAQLEHVDAQLQRLSAPEIALVQIAVLVTEAVPAKEQHDALTALQDALKIAGTA